VLFVEEPIRDACISVITVAEIYQGARDQEENLIASTLSAFRVLPLTFDIAKSAGLYSRDYRQSHGCGLADCLIAATATAHGLTLQTFNKKHFPMLTDVNVPFVRHDA
jgi:predicted nucleic acid-binding protein